MVYTYSHCDKNRCFGTGLVIQILNYKRHLQLSIYIMSVNEQVA